MAEYIDKSALVAEIKARISDIEVSQKAGLIKKRDAETKIILFKSILSLLDTLEVKEVDLDKELVNYNRECVDENGFFNTEHLAKHFFELGMQVSNKAQKGE